MIKKILIAMLLAAAALSAQNADRLVKAVRHELVMLPNYDVFDNLAYRVDGGKVTLFGQVVRPTLKDQAERVVKKLEGVTAVQNEIEVLPLSPNDDRLRLAVFRSVYAGPLQRYSLRAVPPIHIIVKNGNVTLEGAIGSEGDKNLAGIKANGVEGVFSVKNNLAIDK